MEINFFNIVLYFITYSFLGWIMESIYRSFCEKKIINTGFLIGPVCPIYGIGSIIIITIMGSLKGKIIQIFLTSFILLTLWEYIVGIFLEKVFKTKYWDYSDHKINFQGRICLTNSIAWGFLGVGFINYIHPFISSIFSNIPQNILKSITYGALAVMIVDAIISIIKINNIKIKLKKVEELNEEIKRRIKEIKENSKNKVKVTENIQITLEELKSKRDKMTEKLYKYVYRLKQAFPAINTKEIAEILSSKFKLKKTSKEKEHKVDEQEKKDD